MKRMLLLLCLLLALSFSAVLAEDEMIAYGSVSVQKNATYVDLGEQVVADWESFYSFLAQLPEVEKVDMFSTIVNRKSIDQLVNRFPQIKFGWTIHITAEHYVRTDQTAFSTLHGYCPNHDSNTFEVLKYCTELRALDLGHNYVTDISFLEHMPKLRVLILACNDFLGDISVLAQLKELEYLELFSCYLQDLSPLQELPHLMDLNIAYNPRVYSHEALVQMPQLKRLWISNTGILYNNTRMQELYAALPNTTIMTQGEPTQNGWRIGEHYETIYEIFHTDQYKPFADSYPFEEDASLTD